MPLRVSHIIFDVDGTLVDFATSLRMALDVAARRASRLSGSNISPESLQTERDAVSIEPRMSGAPLRAVREEAIRRVLSRHGVDDANAPGDVIAGFFETRDATVRVFDDVDGPLAELESRGFTLVAGDRLENDYYPPRSIGMHSVLVDRADVVRNPGVFRVSSLRSLPSLLSLV